jgi:hypothetical protein
MDLRSIVVSKNTKLILRESAVAKKNLKKQPLGKHCGGVQDALFFRRLTVRPKFRMLAKLCTAKTEIAI